MHEHCGRWYIEEPEKSAKIFSPLKDSVSTECNTEYKCVRHIIVHISRSRLIKLCIIFRSRVSFFTCGIHRNTRMIIASQVQYLHVSHVSVRIYVSPHYTIGWFQNLIRSVWTYVIKQRQTLYYLQVFLKTLVGVTGHPDGELATPAGSRENRRKISYTNVYSDYTCENYEVLHRKAKAQQTNQLHPGQLFFNKELPWVGFEPTTLCSLGERSTNWATRATQLVGVRIYNTRQTSNHCAMAQYTLTYIHR